MPRWATYLFVLLASLAASLYMKRVGPPEAHPGPPPLILSVTTSTASAPTATSTVETNATIVRMVDGDTAVVRVDGETGEVRVRFLGINTPETVDPRKTVECFGKEASAQGKHLLPEGSRVKLVADPQADERDKYDRLLRIVYLADGTQYNRKMVADGFAYAYVTFPMAASYKRELKQAEKDARMGHLGLWATSTCAGLK